MNDRIRRLLRRALVPGVKRIGTAEAVAYLQDVVAPSLSLPPDGDFERVRGGANTAVIRWRTAANDTLYARVWPWNRKNAPVRQHQKAASLLHEAGLHTPEELFADDSTSTITQWGVEVVVEREAPGQPLHRLEKGRKEALFRMAQDLARLHTREGEIWHKPWLRRQGHEDPMVLWTERIARFRERMTPQTCGLTGSEIHEALENLRCGLETASKRTPVLVHGDVSQNHVFIDATGKQTWIDLETVHYGAAEEDLACVSRWLPAQYFAQFLEAYGKAAARQLDPDALVTFRLLMQWERLNSRVQQTRRRQDREGDGLKSLDKLTKDREAAEQAIRQLISGGGPGPSATKVEEPEQPG